MAERFGAHADDLIQLLSIETGKVVPDATFACGAWLRWMTSSSTSTSVLNPRRRRTKRVRRLERIRTHT